MKNNENQSKLSNIKKALTYNKYKCLQLKRGVK